MIMRYNFKIIVELMKLKFLVMIVKIMLFLWIGIESFKILKFLFVILLFLIDIIFCVCW